MTLDGIQPEQLGRPKQLEEERQFATPVEIGGLQYIFKGTVSIFKDVRDIKFSLVTPLSNTADSQEIGFVRAVTGNSADLNIAGKIRSNTEKLPAESAYHGARGVGQFLMNNLLAYCDLRGLTVSAIEDPDTDGRLTKPDMGAWLERKGFEDRGIGQRVRIPRTPDREQEIVKILA